MREPADLPQALHLCLKLENQKFRTHYAQNQNDLPLRKQSYYSPPPLPQRGPNNQRQRQTFYPQLAHVPRFQNNPRFFNYEQVPTNSNQPRQPPPRPIAPKPLPPPEPMDIDRSIRSQQINYANRPQANQFLGKRPPQPSSQRNIQPNKTQRVFHIDADSEDTYEGNGDYDQTLTEHVDSIESENRDEELVLSDVHFLG